MIAGWDDPWELFVEAVGTLPFNQPYDTTHDWRFQLVPARCSAALSVRTTEDDVPQADGKIAHRRWRGGFRVHLAIALLNEELTDCKSGADLVAMLDTLGLFLNAAIRTGLVPGSPNARLIWTPDGAPDRMFDRVQLAGEPTVSIASDADDALGGTLVEADFDTVHPYYISAAETQTALADGDTVTIVNDGNTDYFPAVLAYGPFTAFTLTNNSVTDLDGNPLSLIYDSDLPGANAIVSPNYIEFSFFAGTAYLNGNQANRKAGIDMRSSEFFPLVPGNNSISLTVDGGDGTDTLVLIKSNDAYA